MATNGGENEDEDSNNDIVDTIRIRNKNVSIDINNENIISTSDINKANSNSDTYNNREAAEVDEVQELADTIALDESSSMHPPPIDMNNDHAELHKSMVTENEEGNTNNSNELTLGMAIPNSIRNVPDVYQNIPEEFSYSGWVEDVKELATTCNSGQKIVAIELAKIMTLKQRAHVRQKFVSDTEQCKDQMRKSADTVGLKTDSFLASEDANNSLPELAQSRVNGAETKIAVSEIPGEKNYVSLDESTDSRKALLQGSMRSNGLVATTRALRESLAPGVLEDDNSVIVSENGDKGINTVSNKRLGTAEVKEVGTGDIPVNIESSIMQPSRNQSNSKKRSGTMEGDVEKQNKAIDVVETDVVAFNESLFIQQSKIHTKSDYEEIKELKELMQGEYNEVKQLKALIKKEYDEVRQLKKEYEEHLKALALKELDEVTQLKKHVKDLTETTNIGSELSLTTKDFDDEEPRASVLTNNISLVLAANVAFETSFRKYTEAKDKTLGRMKALDNAFDIMDIKGNDILDATEIGVFLEAAARHVKLDLSKEVIEDAVRALMDDAKLQGDQTSTLDDLGTNEDYLTRSEFFSIFDRHPDMLRVFDGPSTRSIGNGEVKSREMSFEATKTEAQEKENEREVYDYAHTHWKNKGKAIIWLSLFAAANIVAFSMKAVKYANKSEATAVFGNCVVVARGCAQCLNLNAFVILLPICRHFVTYLRHYSWIQNLFPFGAVLDIHIWVGISIALFTTGHVTAHICDIHRFALADEEDIQDLFGDKLGPIPESPMERWLLVLRHRAGITGIIMVVCMLIAYPVTLTRRKNFNRFWILHHLLLVMLIALCFHGTGNLLEPFQSIYWVAVPFVLYILPRIYRELKCSRLKVLSLAIKKSVVAIRLEKPSSWENSVKAGMYGFLNIPAVSCLEWHPFTLTSSPKDDFIGFHFARSGDWTGKVHDLLKEIAEENNNCGEEGGEVNTSNRKEVSTTLSNLAVYVEGPIGASSQGYSKYPIVILVGAGIGVTPMISVLRQLLVEPGKMMRTYFYWTVRDRAAFQWFKAAMENVYEKDHKRVLEVRQFLTSMKDDDRDIGAVLLRHATRARHSKTNFDLILGCHTHRQVQVGRPDWEMELESIRLQATELGHKQCGIFFCGPQAMSKAIKEVSFGLSRKNSDFHFYFSKETF